MVGNVLASSTPECNADNRPLTPAPFAKDGSGRQFNLNKVLREETAWRRETFLISMANPIHVQIATFQRLYQNHKTGGKFDVKTESGKSEWLGDMEFGNFLYGAILRQHGFTLSEAQRYGAAYQAFQNNDHKLSMKVMAQGIRNFITNTGDSPGDKEIIARGFRYARDVYSKNPSDSNSMSCIDQRTLDQAGSGGGGGGGGEGGGAPSNGGGGKLWYSCELWYFSSGLTNGMFYMEKNCSFWMTP
jgi:uncharacterized membrane protein YgcG